MIRCCICNQERDESKFTHSQSKKKNKAKCIQCTEAQLAALEAVSNKRAKTLELEAVGPPPVIPPGKRFQVSF
jgi:hypothetical protein